MKRITEMFAYVIEDDGVEGVPAFKYGDTAMPLVGADMERMESLKPVAQQVANMTGKTVRLLKFRLADAIRHIEPEGK